MVSPDCVDLHCKIAYINVQWMMQKIKDIEYNSWFAANKFLYSCVGPMLYIHDDEFLLFNGIRHFTRHFAL